MGRRGKTDGKFIEHKYELNYTIIKRRDKYKGRQNYIPFIQH